jgi:hypothetical protein
MAVHTFVVGWQKKPFDPSQGFIDCSVFGSHAAPPASGTAHVPLLHDSERTHGEVAVHGEPAFANVTHFLSTQPRLESQSSSRSHAAPPAPSVLHAPHVLPLDWRQSLPLH